MLIQFFMNCQQNSSFLQDLFLLFHQELDTQIPGLRGATHYYFDGKGKLFRPMAVILAGYASNFHLTGQR